MMITIITPIIKNKTGDLSDNNNYRPLVLATIASKLFESLILSRVSIFLTACVNQFGYYNLDLKSIIQPKCLYFY